MWTGRDGWAVYFEEEKGKEYRCFWLSKRVFWGGGGFRGGNL